MDALPRVPAWAKALLVAAILALTLCILLHKLGSLNRDEIGFALRNASAKRLYECGALTVISFLALGSYDMFAVGRIASRRVSPWRAWLAGAIANAMSNTLGFHALTGTAVRYRLLKRWGLTGPDIASVTALSWTALALGFASMFSLALITSEHARLWQQVGGFTLLGLLLLSTRWLGDGKSINRWALRLRLPSTRQALAQMGLGAVEMASAIGALYVLMPAGAVPTFPVFSAIYIGAVLLGIASHAPGGLGVFEAAMLALANGQDHAGILAALLLYRLIYNLGPFLLASLALAVDEMRAIFSSKADSA